ncbi:MAG: hypothetical protein JEY94_05115 [Melioribacteraceae bacterium]|nr:hypothetical protein [Melioribacteraceae bacterium]
MEKLKKYKNKILAVAAGAVLGYSYYYFIGCTSGSCPITSNPLISTVYGAAIGFVFSMSSKKEKNDGKDN